MQMNRSFLVGTLMAVAGVTPCLAAAQDEPTGPESTGVGIHAGIFLPVNAAARANGTAWLAYGASYRLLTLNSNADSRTSITFSADYYGQSGWSEAPVLLNWVATSHHVFVSAGAGVGFSNEPTGSGTDLAYQGSIGYSFPATSSASFFVEAKYWGCDRSEFDGFGLYAGVHF
jgi:hypothetical protein